MRFQGYRRKDGGIGIRNIVAIVFCTACITDIPKFKMERCAQVYFFLIVVLCFQPLVMVAAFIPKRAHFWVDSENGILRGVIGE